MTHPPALSPELVEGALHLVLGSSAYTAAPGEHKPVTRAEAQASRNQQQPAASDVTPMLASTSASNKAAAVAGRG
jgi:hypothetical protein